MQLEININDLAIAILKSTTVLRRAYELAEAISKAAARGVELGNSHICYVGMVEALREACPWAPFVDQTGAPRFTVIVLRFSERDCKIVLVLYGDQEIDITVEDIEPLRAEREANLGLAMYPYLFDDEDGVRNGVEVEVVDGTMVASLTDLAIWADGDSCMHSIDNTKIGKANRRIVHRYLDAYLDHVAALPLVSIA